MIARHTPPGVTTGARPGDEPWRGPQVSDGGDRLVETVMSICERAAQGDLEARITGVDAASPMAPMCHAINRMLDLADAFVREASAAMDHCSNGQYHRPILPRGHKGAYRQGASIINGAAAAMRENAEHIAFVARLAAENVAVSPCR